VSYISAASTISHQPTFRNAGFSDVIEPLSPSSALISPDYKGFIDAGLLRRMSKILRMSVACAKDCLEQAGIEQPDAILVGTGLGCLQDTEKFLNHSITVEGLLPPTSFIQSTHNTMAGQISLNIGNHAYNMTHTQNTLSFEHALRDTLLLLEEGEAHVLVGAADEYIEFLTEVSTRLNVFTQSQLASGASFFILSGERTPAAFARIKDVRTVGLVNDVATNIASFLADNGSIQPDLILYTGNIEAELDRVGLDMTPCRAYTDLSGIYATASSFALHYATDLITRNPDLRHILICNSLINSNLGLTLVQAIET
jgi:3-oxoacyl-[acyl-carrier-protein] synthase II